MISGRRSFRLFCAVLLPSLFCLVPAPAAAHTHPFHKGLARLSVVTAGGYFPWLRKSIDSLERGSTQPDFDRGFQVWENDKHKHDAGLVSQNFRNAVARFGEHAKLGDLDVAWSEGARILAKAFHYFADQSEPMFGRRALRFQAIMGASPRDVADRTVAGALAGGGKGEFRSAVDHYVRQYRLRGFTPTSAAAVAMTLQAVEDGLAKRVAQHLQEPHPLDQAGARREIEAAYFQYVAQLVALQNVSVKLFDQEARKLIPGEEPATRTSLTGPEPPPASGDISGSWRRGDGHVVNFSGSGATVTGTIVTLTPVLTNCGFTKGETTFKLQHKEPGKYTGQIKWRSPGGQSWWQDVTMTVSGERMTGGGDWVRVR
jgi:hypothetical protein